MIKIIEAIDKDINDDMENIRIFSLVKKGLEKHFNKTVTKRVEKPVQDVLNNEGDFTVWLDKSYSYTTLKVRNNTTKRDHQFTMYYHSNNEGKILVESDFDKWNTCYYLAAQERIAKNLAVKNDKKLIDKLERKQKLINELNELENDSNLSSYNFPARYEVNKVFGYKLEKIKE
jgi:hypothetical protein